MNEDLMTQTSIEEMDATAEWAMKQNQEEAKKEYSPVPLGAEVPHSPFFFDAIKLKHQVVKELLE